ncbi:MAG: translocation/assembly module TamB domain-containing protein [Maritimibacter sp.]|nr:translocation/assembly module TamB domain-containing protein [Maritimibacter sp.]
MTRRVLLLPAVLALTVLPLFAQDEAVDDKTFLENLLQDKLSAAGRAVEITGFQGALSSRAVMQRLTVADDEGVWLTIEGAELAWTRSALLTGRLEINALTAERIEVARPPVAVSDGPQATTSDFALPELPVAINIGEISAEVLVLGETVLGVPAELSLAGGGRLDGGAGEAVLTLDRIDGQAGHFAISAAYANESRNLALDLDLDEGADGIVATLTGLPGSPPLAFSLKGEGPIDAYAADLSLATDGAERLGGQVTLSRASAEAPMGFTAELAGDPSPLLAPDYRGFFGDDVRLSLAGARDAAGWTELSRLEIVTEALDLAGSAVIGAGGWPERVALSGRVAAPDGAPVVLPFGGDQTRIARADITLDYDAAAGDDWHAEAVLDGLGQADMTLDRATITAEGTLTLAADGTPPGFAGHVALTADGITGADGGAAAALGPRLAGQVDIDRQSGVPLRFSNLDLAGTDYRLTGDFTLDTDVDKLDLIAEVAVALDARDLGRFAGLAGQKLSGAARLDVAGTAALPGGPFDVEISGTGKDLAIGIAEADRLFAGASTLSLAANRTADGTEIERFEIRAPGASASGAGWLAETDSQIAARVDLPDATLVAEGLDGALAVEATARQEVEGWQIALQARGPGGARASFAGLAETGPTGIGGVGGDFTFAAERLAAWSGLARRDLGGSVSLSGAGRYEPDTGKFEVTGTGAGQDLDFDLGSADPLLAGRSDLGFAVKRRKNGVIVVDRFSLTTPELTLEATGKAEDEMPRIRLSGRLRNMALFVPSLPGAVTAEGSAKLSETGWAVKLAGEGPGGTTFKVVGDVAADSSTADLDLAGRLPLAIANESIAPQQLAGMAAFDLTLNGPLALGSVAGTVKLDGARAAVPTAGLALDPLNGSVALAGGRADVNLSGRVSSGGRITVTGPVRLAAPYPGDLAIRLFRVDLRDDRLFDLRANGDLAISGPLAGGATIGGRVELGPVELRIPETGFGVDGNLPGLKHVGAPAAVRKTQARAGLTETGSSGGGGTPYGLDIAIAAPSQVFIRGRGLDAELGGALVVGGSTADVVTTGDVKLIRGRLDILGNRLALTEGYATLRGSLDPWLHLVAETETDGVTVRIAVDGLASDPTITFTSSPDLPEDEILARLVFGRGLDQISPFQALKLASAVATLSGKGGVGTIGKLRQGFGLDDLDVTTDADGELAVRAGTYISDNIYTDVTVGAGGQAEVNLNLTITPEITAKGTVSSDGSTGLGIFFEKDY